ncbi:MAG: ankyrin repeat domain-containing protein [Elusimicrobiaceae bacterium]|nr:ankyrin repeat domain-containing protein [Elusimicrobiaceae bacterium]
MPLKKTTTRISATSPKQVRQVIQKAKNKPKVAITVLALIPFLAMLIFTLKGRPSHVQSRQAANINVIVPGQTPQELAEEATLALRKGDTMAFFDILDTKIKDPNIVNSHGDTLLLAAATLGNLEAVQRLLSMGADVNKQNAFSRDTAVLRSVYGDHDAITQILVYENADLNLPNNYRQTPMGLAVEKQKGQLVDLFLTKGVKAGLNSETLFRAVAQKNYVGVMAMLKGNVEPNVKNSAGNTPLIISASLGDTMSVQALLAYRADVNASNNDGNTALIYAARYNHPNTIMALTAPLTLQYKADLNMQNKRGETALYWAAMKGYAQVVKILLAYDADPSLKTNTDQTPLDAAKKYKREDVIALLQMPINELKEQFNQELQSRQSAESEAQPEGSEEAEESI